VNPTPTNPNSLLKEIAKIQQMERGKISVIRKTLEGCFYNHQTWENGQNVSRYVPCDQVTALQEAIDGYQQFKQLTEEYAQQIINKTRAERAANIKKNAARNLPRPRRRNPTTDGAVLRAKPSWR
jgi:hypothetical protein